MNVILVDFRGFDTLGEIVVLGVAAIGVLVLLHRKARKAKRPGEEPTPESSHASGEATPDLSDVPEHVPNPGHRGWRGPGPWRHGYGLTSEPLRVVTKLLVPLSLLFAAFIFLKGHQTPGGGFVAGLVAAVALAAHRMAHGRASLRHLLPVRERTLIGSGLLIAVLTGAGAMVAGKPFLTSRYGYLTVPGTDQQIEWATVIGFDLGVLLVVIGVVQMMINALHTEAEGE